MVYVMSDDDRDQLVREVIFDYDIIAIFRCRWLCKREYETWPVYDEDYINETIPFQVTNESAYYYPDDSGGCFRDKTNSSGMLV